MGLDCSVDEAGLLGGTAPAMLPQKSEAMIGINGNEELQIGDVIQEEMPVVMLVKPNTTPATNLPSSRA
jgi:hypothetical protein